MAKISKIVKNEKRKKLSIQYAERRAALKKIINNPTSSPEQVDEAVLKLQKIPRDASPVRYRNRCSQTGRPRGYLENRSSRAWPTGSDPRRGEIKLVGFYIRQAPEKRTAAI